MKNTHCFLSNRYFTALLLGCIALISACATNKNINSAPGFLYPEAVFAVISDTHISDPSLGFLGPVLSETPDSGQKLLLDSVELLDHAIKTLIPTGVSFVLVCGDLTKDGELASHRLMAEKLKTFTDAGIAVYVIPGNHDINNPNAASLEEGVKKAVPAISAEEFSQIYSDFGFNVAFMRDTDSLSYAAEPVEGLWLLAIDSCRYREYTPENGGLSSGKLSRQTTDWIISVLQAAAGNNKAVMVMMHHGIVEHWKGQAKFHASYLVNDYQNFGKLLASRNVTLAFTGHYHSQDIALGKFGRKRLYDIETGSLLTPPCSIRFVTIKDNAIHIQSETIVDTLYPGTDFAQNAESLAKQTIKTEAIRLLRRYKITGEDADYIADAVADAFYAHFSGDENPALCAPFDKSRLGLWSRIAYSRLKHIINSLWTDLPPADNNVQFGL